MISATTNGVYLSMQLIETTLFFFCGDISFERRVRCHYYKTNNIFTVVYVTTFMPLQKMAYPTMPLPSYQKMDYLIAIGCVSQTFHPTWIACIISVLFFSLFFSNINLLIDSGCINERKLISSD